MNLYPPLKAVIFDMDGVLADTEPLWQQAELEIFGALGVPLTPAIAVHAARFPTGALADPADRIIAASAVVEGVPLVSADERIAALAGVEIIWD